MQQPVHRKRPITTLPIAMPSPRQTMPSNNLPSQSSPKIHPHHHHHPQQQQRTITNSSSNNNNNFFFHRAKNTFHRFQSTACAFLFFLSLEVLWNARLSYIERINVYPDPQLYTAPKKNAAALKNQTAAAASKAATPTTFTSQSHHHPSSHGLRAIVTGLEHSGTTLTGSLLINAPCIMGAFETGYLLASSPKHIEDADPWYRWNSAITNTLDINYRLSDEDIREMKSCANFLDMYHTLRQRSYLFNQLNDESYCTTPTEMIDKTPRYVYPKYFEDVLKKTPGVPVVVTRKKFDKLAESWNRRENNLTREFYRQTFENVYRMKIKYPHRILVIEEEDLMMYPEAVMMDVFHHVGGGGGDNSNSSMEWKSEYLQMKGLLKKFRNDTRTLRQIEHWKFSPGKHSPDRKD